MGVLQMYYPQDYSLIYTGYYSTPSKSNLTRSNFLYANVCHSFNSHPTEAASSTIWCMQLVETGDRLWDARRLQAALEDELQWEYRPIDPTSWLLPDPGSVTLDFDQVSCTSETVSYSASIAMMARAISKLRARRLFLK
jgi:hypothetical protein